MDIKGAKTSAIESSNLSSLSLDERISFYTTRLELPTLSSAERITVSTDLATDFCNLFEENGNPDDLQKAVFFGEKALALATKDIQIRSTVLSNLSQIYRIKFKHDRKENNIMKAIDMISEAINAATKESSALVDMLIIQGTILCDAYLYMDDKQYVDGALDAFDKAIERSDDVNTQALAMNNKSNALNMRYARTMTLEDLKEAITIVQKGYDLAEDASTKALCARTLSGALVNLARRSSDHEALLCRAISLGNMGLSLVPEGHPTRAQCHYVLGLAYLLRYDKDQNGGDIDDLDRARECIITSSSGLESRNQDEIDPNVILMLGYQKLFGKTGELSYLNKAIEHGERTVDAAKSQKADFPTYQTQLAMLLRTRFEKESNKVDFARAVALNKDVLDEPLAGIFERIAAGVQLCSLFLCQGYFVQGYEALRESVHLMPKLTSNSIQHQDQQWWLGWLSGLSPKAASLALKASESATTAFLLLELGRCTLLNLTILRRSELDESLFSQKEAQNLLQQYEKIRKEISQNLFSSSPHITINVSASVRISTRYKQMKRAEELEAAIRELPRLGNFQKSLTEAEIKQLASADFLVAFNITGLGSDAFIISNDYINSIRLPSLDYDEAQSYLKLLCGPSKITKSTLRTFNHNNQKMVRLLTWLWEVAVKPVLAHLQLLEVTPTKQLPTVYWIMSGVLGLMPLHAAGRYTDLSKDYTMCYVVSSYLLSTKAFSWSLDRIRRESPSEADISNKKSLFISMPSTPGWPDLDSDSESKAFKRCMPNATMVERPSSNSVLDLLGEAAFVHFACHATADPADPSEGRIILYNKEKDAVDPLTVHAVSGNSIVNIMPRLAYLSACETADVQALDLVDESIHLAASFQAIGFPHVIGTFWEAQNDVASEIATTFYSSLEKEGAVKLLFSREREEQQKVAKLLHDAVSQLVVRDPDEPLSWANFIHFGI